MKIRELFKFLEEYCGHIVLTFILGCVAILIIIGLCAAVSSAANYDPSRNFVLSCAGWSETKDAELVKQCEATAYNLYNKK